MSKQKLTVLLTEREAEVLAYASSIGARRLGTGHEKSAYLRAMRHLRLAQERGPSRVEGRA